MKNTQVKEQLFIKCKAHVQKRREAVQSILDSVAISLQEETKSSAGDKHETGRAMLQLERENAGKQLAQIEQLERIAHRIDPKITSGPAHLGSVIETTAANYYLSIPAGEITVGTTSFYAVGVGSPIGQLLLGKKEGDVIRFRESEYTITTIY